MQPVGYFSHAVPDGGHLVYNDNIHLENKISLVFFSALTVFFIFLYFIYNQ